MEESNQKKAELLKLYSNFAENVSKSHFNPCVEEGLMIENFDEIILKNFKKELTETMTSKIEQIWKNANIGMNLSALETIKKQCSSLNENEWRPTDKSVSEILRPQRIETLKSKIAFYQEQLEAMKPKLEESICELENKREEMENKLADRRELSDKVNDMMCVILKTDYDCVDN